MADLVGDDLAGPLQFLGGESRHPGELGRVVDRREGIAQLVGEHRQEFVLAAVGLAKDLLGPLPFGHVADDLGEAPEPARLIEQGRDQAAPPEPRAVPPEVPALVVAAPPGPGSVEVAAGEPGLDVLLGVEHADRPADQLVLEIAEDGAGPCVGAGDQPPGVHRQDRVVADAVQGQAVEPVPSRRAASAFRRSERSRVSSRALRTAGPRRSSRCFRT